VPDQEGRGPLAGRLVLMCSRIFDIFLSFLRGSNDPMGYSDVCMDNEKMRDKKRMRDCMYVQQLSKDKEVLEHKRGKEFQINEEEAESAALFDAKHSKQSSMLFVPHLQDTFCAFFFFGVNFDFYSKLAFCEITGKNKRESFHFKLLVMNTSSVLSKGCKTSIK
jgi:hypothetical protein